MKTIKANYSILHSYLNVTVSDRFSKQPIPFVKVSLPECGLYENTDSNGRAFIHAIPPEIYYVRFEVLGFFVHTQLISFQLGEVREERITLVSKIF